MNNFKFNKPLNPFSEKKEIGDIYKVTNPGTGPLNIPKSSPTPQFHTSPNQFEKLRRVLSGKK